MTVIALHCSWQDVLDGMNDFTLKSLLGIEHDLAHLLASLGYYFYFFCNTTPLQATTFQKRIIYLLTCQISIPPHYNPRQPQGSLQHTKAD